MDAKLFAELIESMTEAGEIARGERAPSREFRVGETVKDVRQALLDGEHSGEPEGFDFDAFTRRKRAQHDG